MEIFVPIVTGVYRHGTLGAFTTREAAERAGRSFIESESDHYHSVDIVKYVLDEVEPDEQSVVELRWLPDSRKFNDAYGPGKVVPMEEYHKQMKLRQ